MTKIFSGMRPSGKLHLGNYLGAIKNWIDLQNQPDTTQCIFAVVDLHGITTPYDPGTLQAQIHDVILDYLAAGINPDRALLIRQSKVPEHSELMWLLSTITPVGWLERLPNYREKVKQVEEFEASNMPKMWSGQRSGPEAIEAAKNPLKAAKEDYLVIEKRIKSYTNNLGLLAYPVLMAADILLYKSDLVPVGEDQLLHLGLANDLGTKFNHLFGETFPQIKPYTDKYFAGRIMSLQDPTKKMSKMGDDGIALSDDPDTVRGKIKRAVTDSGTEVQFDEKEKPAITNLLTIYSTLSGTPVKKLEQEYAGKNYGQFKTELAEVIIGFLQPFQERRAALVADVPAFERLLTESEEKARIIASTHLSEIKAKMGLR